MRARSAVVVSIALMVSGWGWSQDRLGDVAGSIKLDPAAIVEKTGYVEDQRAAEKADRQLLEETLASSLEAADRLASLIEEARATVLYGDSVLPSRLSAAAVDLDTQVQELALLRLKEAFAAPAATAQEAAQVCIEAGAAVREELARNGVAFTRAREVCGRCLQELGRAETQLAAVGNEDAAGSVSEDSDEVEATGSSADDEIVARICEPERAQGDAAHEACEDRQYQALAALTSRTANNEMLEASVFDGVRAVCAELHPADFERRNICELEKMTAIRLEEE